ncbi:MAG TPA: polyprenyl diphosphate synthase [Gammaproteobacteria bacterium]
MHVAIIMDGNGRWARERGLPRSAGHRAGADVVRTIVETAAAEGVDVLTLYAFSSDNWNRPAREVNALMRLLRRYLDREVDCCRENDVRLNVIGRRDRLGLELEHAIERAERRTAACRRLLLRLAVDYSARDSIVRAAAAMRHGPADRPAFERRLAEVTHSVRPVGAVDLLIRTGGELRLSDFLLWECAYAELVFSPTYWPDYTAREFRAALAAFRTRDRRFGGLSSRARPRALAV